MAKVPKAKAQPKVTKEQVLAMLRQLGDEEVSWVLKQLNKKRKRVKGGAKEADAHAADKWWSSFLSDVVGMARGPGGAISEEHDRWVYVKDWEERGCR